LNTKPKREIRIAANSIVDEIDLLLRWATKDRKRLSEIKRQAERILDVSAYIETKEGDDNV
jgi:hypothetical protein